MLFLYYVFQEPYKIVEPWPVVSDTIPNYNFIRVPESCVSDDDCSQKHVCIQGTCIPKIPRGDQCYKPYGTWQTHIYSNKTFTLCTCDEPRLMDQKHVGGNCSLPVACDGHGDVDLFEERCNCWYGFQPGKEKFSCEKLPLVALDCSGDEFSLLDESTAQRHGLSKDYIDKMLQLGVKCYKLPCKYDVLTGKRLKNNIYLPPHGCICDPKEGSVAVRITPGPYLQASGPNACLNILENSKGADLDVIFYQYFYIGNRDPISFIAFKKLKRENVVSAFRDRVRDDALMVGEYWPYTHLQHVMKHQLIDVRYRTTNIEIAPNVYPEDYVPSLFAHHTYYENLISKNYVARLCTDLDKIMKNINEKYKPNVYLKLYTYPICKVPENHPSTFQNTIILNPYHVTFEHSFGNIVRSNGLKAFYQSHSKNLYLDFADDYRVDYYLANNERTNVPKF